MKHISIHRFFFFILFAVFFFYLPALAKGQTTTTNEDPAKKYGITYPISSLGNCIDYTSCRNYCEDETHRTTCIQYAKQKGFYKEQKTDEIVTRAKTELGCNSETECKNFCEKEENFEKCANFATKAGLVKKQALSPKNQEILNKAKEVLGCDSPQTCKSICDQEGNRQKCSEFAKQTGLKGGEEKRGPGGCNSDETCKTFCSNPDNLNECSKFKPAQGQEHPSGPPQGGSQGPGGCNSEQSCRQYCEKNPSACQKFGSGPEGKKDERDRPQEEMKQKQEEMEKFGGSGPPQNMKRENIQPQDAQDAEKFCKENPEKCKERSEKRPPDFKNQQEPRNTFCKDNPEKCQNQGPPPANQAAPSPQGPPPEVKGATTVRNIIKTLFNLIFSK